MGCAGGCARFLLFFFNFLFWLSGGAILGLGIYFLVSDDISNMIKVVHIDKTLPLFSYSAYILIAFGALIFVVGFCGCCGAIRKSQCLLGFYIFFLVIIMGGEIAAATLIIMYKNEIHAGLKDRLKDGVKNDYKSSPSFKVAWDVVQVVMKCCGAEGPKDWDTSTWRNRTSTQRVPKTCCVLEEANPADPSPTNNILCQAQAYLNVDTKFMHKEGCFKTIEMFFTKNVWIFGGVGFGLAALEIFGFIFALCVCRHSKKENDLA